MIKEGDMREIEGFRIQSMKRAVLQCAFHRFVHVTGLQPIFLRIFRSVIHRPVNVLAGLLTPFLVYRGACTERTVTSEKNGTRGPPGHLRPCTRNRTQYPATEIHHVKAPPILPYQGIGRNRMLTKIFPSQAVIAGKLRHPNVFRDYPLRVECRLHDFLECLDTPHHHVKLLALGNTHRLDCDSPHIKK
ncbi:Uncharacterised protein [Mycobacteroides abscessus subsp. massiliense]|nr:Uncharacterised protein [Mycobacteroides abscessus subsp. massiliense]